MNTPPSEPLSEVVTTPLPLPYQKRQARRWLSILLVLSQLILLAAIAWLIHQHYQLQKQINEQKQTNQTLTSQVHDIDDKLVKIHQPIALATSTVASETIDSDKNQLDVLKVQLQTADMLLAKADYPAVKALLGVIDYQLNQPSNGLTPAMRLTLSNSLKQDQQIITKLQSQPNVWQNQSMTLVDIQKFLQKKHADYQQQIKTNPADAPLTYAQVQLFEMLTTLNFALQASQNQQSDLYLTYTNQLQQQANAFVTNEKATEPTLLSNADVSQLQDMVKKVNEQLPTTPRLQTGQILVNQTQSIPAIYNTHNTIPASTTVNQKDTQK